MASLAAENNSALLCIRYLATASGSLFRLSQDCSLSIGWDCSATWVWVSSSADTHWLAQDSALGDCKTETLISKGLPTVPWHVILHKRPICFSKAIGPHLSSFSHLSPVDPLLKLHLIRSGPAMVIPWDDTALMAESEEELFSWLFLNCHLALPSVSLYFLCLN